MYGCRALKTRLRIHILSPSKKIAASLVAIDDSNIIDEIPERVIYGIIPIAIVDLWDCKNKVLSRQIEDHPRIDGVNIRFDYPRTIDRCKTSLMSTLIHVHLS